MNTLPLSAPFPSAAPASGLPAGPGSAWSRAEVCCCAELVPALEAVAAALEAAGYPTEDRFAVRLALEEAVVNALVHGHGGDPGKVVRLAWRVYAEGVVATVEDEGPGFDPEGVPDPLHPDNRERPSGRGLLLIRTFMTTVSYSRPRRRLALWKRRSTSKPAQPIRPAENAVTRVGSR